MLTLIFCLIFFIIPFSSCSISETCTKYITNLESTLNSLENEYKSTIINTTSCNSEIKKKLNENVKKFNIAFSNNENNSEKLKKISQLIKKNNYEDAVEQFKQIKTLQLFKDLLKDIVNESDTRFSENVIKFLDQLDNLGYSVLGYKILYNALRTKNSFIKTTIAYRVLKLAYDDSTPINDNTMENLKYIFNNLPINLTSFPFNTEFSIRNKAFYDYLIESKIDYDDDRGKVFTQKIEPIKNDTWLLETINNGLTFRILTKSKRNYLYADNDKYLYDKERRRIFLKIGNNLPKYAEWKLEYMLDGSFRIKSNYWDEYLYDADGFNYDDDNRRIFTWTPRGCDGNSCKWFLTQINYVPNVFLFNRFGPKV